MRIFLTIILASYILSVQAQKDFNSELLHLEFAVWQSHDSITKWSIIQRKAELLTENGLFEESNAELNRITLSYIQDSNTVFYKKSLNFFLSGAFGEAYDYLIEIPDSVRLHNTEYSTLWLFTLNELNRWEDCKAILLKLIPAEDSLFSEMNALPVEVNLLSPSKAKKLSGIFPGTGLFYAGYPFKAMTSILLHATFIFLTVECVVSGLFVTSAVYGLVPVLRFYFGGKENSYLMTVERNQIRVNDIKSKYRTCVVLLREKL